MPLRPGGELSYLTCIIIGLVGDYDECCTAGDLYLVRGVLALHGTHGVAILEVTQHRLQ